MVIEDKSTLARRPLEIPTVVGIRIVEPKAQIETAKLKDKSRFAEFRALLESGTAVYLRTSTSVACLATLAQAEPEAARLARAWDWSVFRRLPRFTTQVSALRQEILALRQGRLHALLIPVFDERFALPIKAAIPKTADNRSSALHELVVELRQQTDRLASLVAILEQRDHADSRSRENKT